MADELEAVAATATYEFDETYAAVLVDGCEELDEVFVY